MNRMNTAVWKSLAGKGGEMAWKPYMDAWLGGGAGLFLFFEDERELIMFSGLRNIPEIY